MWNIQEENRAMLIGKIELLTYLIGIAQEDKAALWRALFAELLARAQAQLKAIEPIKGD